MLHVENSPGRADTSSMTASGDGDGFPDGADCWSTVIHLEHWRAGDPAAFEALHKHFAKLLRTRVRRHRVWPMLEVHMELDDVIQEVWTRAVPAAQRNFAAEGPGSFLAFLGRIADRTMVDLVRSLRAARRGRSNGAASLRTEWERHCQPKPGTPTLETPTSHARSSELLQIAREVLGDRELDAWRLVEIDGYSAEEAALAMRCSGAAVRGLLLRIRAKLVTRLGRS